MQHTPSLLESRTYTLSWCSNDTIRIAVGIVIVSSSVFLNATEARAKDDLLLTCKKRTTVAGRSVIANDYIIALGTIQSFQRTNEKYSTV